MKNEDNLFPTNEYKKEKPKKEPKVSLEFANDLIDQIEDELGSMDEITKAVVLDRIQRGLIDFDKANSVITFTFEKPVGDYKSVNFRELTTDELMKINKGEVVTGDQKGNFEIALKSQKMQKTFRMLVELNGKPTDISKLKKRDFEVCMVLSDFLG